MATGDDLKRALCEAIDRRADDIIAVGRTLERAPELGFKEVKTARLVGDELERLGLSPRRGLAITGVRADLACAKPGPTLALIGELDALVVEGHPLADATTGAAHACGHNCQIAGLLGAAWALHTTGAAQELAGRIALFAVPAEEYGDLAWRAEQAAAGSLEFLTGKSELLRLGHLDDIALAMMIHTTSTSMPEEKRAAIGASYNGCVVKSIRYVGRASHAGGAPHAGVNALYAANLGLTAINALRETFRDEDSIRVHPIITHGGSQVNVIPADVRVETYVRGKSVEAIADASRKVDRALRAGALALGARVEIETRPGYLPLQNHRGLGELFARNAARLVGEDGVAWVGHRTPSTDMGDLSHVMPILHPHMGGARGGHHAIDWEIVDPNLAYVVPAKALVMMAVDLLGDGAARAKNIVASWRAPMTKATYLAYQRGIAGRAEFDGAAAS
jgi:amidohydrolase